MAELKKVRVQLLDEVTGEVTEEVNVMTSPEAVLFPDGKTLTEKLNGISLTPGPKGDNGATFTPSVNAAGLLSWTNDKGLNNPAAVNIKGGKGDKGDPGATGATGPQGPAGPAGNAGSSGVNGATFTPTLSSAGVLSWTNDKGLSNPAAVNIKGPKGDTGLQGAKGDKGDPGAKGATGATGATGPQGPKGDTGAKGATGATGPKGDIGPKGDPGDTVKVGATLATAVQKKLFFKVVS